MSKTIKIILGIILFFIIIGLFWKNQANKEREITEKKPILIGVTGPLTGDAADYGQNVRNAIELALEEINNSGGMKGRRFKIIYEDHACESLKAVTAIQKLIHIDKVSIIIDEACSSCALAGAPIAESNKVLLILPTASNYKIKEAGDYIFRIYPSDAFQGKKLAEMVISENYDKAAIIYKNDDYGFGLKEVFEEEFKKLGGKIITVEAHGVGEADFRSIITKIKYSQSNVLVLADDSKYGALILKQARELNLNVPIYGSDAMKDESLIDVANYAAEGLITVFPNYPKEANYKSVESLYERKYGKSPAGYALYGYDTLKLIASVIDKVGSDPTDIKNELYNVKDYKGVTGIIAFDDFGERISVDYDSYIVENKQFIPLK
nr:hypothetical protein [Nanoarchaeum sp.]